MAAVSASYDLRFDAGRVCLDLVATVGGRFGDEPVERLDSPGRLGQWLVGAGLLPPGMPLDALDTSWLARFHAVRDLLCRVVCAELEGRAAGVDVERVNALASIGPPAMRAVRAADGTLVRTLATRPDCAALLAQIARDAIDLLTDQTAKGQLRRCEGETCALIYLDTSRGRRRRWCSSEVCGNRERVARHRRRAVAARA
ncbi:CGNR zinc finger domain-containing protein [Streptomyces zagrosensis]|uniref:Putative RNA-binding Zn ribbon-like protein n=1 Tax=Streptomyces zagrosensis TaxID=1042984 RepID=A0A7W9Q7Z0_9ACTN|nr:CGNR zinc finger domain-containing protein [Streptomyces zagrosensis]MBB5935269.1 putative RNA-binding Zn ribbon-like protein [Streptomyces zagrosensis]